MTLEVYTEPFEEDLDAVTVALDNARLESAGLSAFGHRDPPGGTANAALTMESDDGERVPPLGFEPRLGRF